jgi:hypothetical protein
MGWSQLFYPTELLHRFAREQMLEAGRQGNIPPQRIPDALGEISSQSDYLAFYRTFFHCCNGTETVWGCPANV